MINIKANSVLAVIGTVDPVAVTTVELFTDVVDMTKYDQVLAVAMTGDMAASTFDFKFYGCDSNGANPTAAVKSATQRGSSATANDGIQIELNIRGADMPAAKPRYGKFGIVASGSGGVCCCLVLGTLKYDLASLANLASVVETKA